MGVHINPFTGKLDVVDSPSGDFSDLTLDLGTAAAPSISFDGDPNTGIYSPGADQLALSTNGTGRLFVDASGRVGIKRTPTAVFDIEVNNTAFHIGFGANYDNYYTCGAGGDQIFRASTNERLRITSDGKVGLGSSVPVEALTTKGSIAVGDTVNCGVKFYDASPVASALRWWLANNPGDSDALSLFKYDASGNYGGNAIKVESNGSINVDGGGLYYDASTNRLGVGTTSPTNTALHVEGSGVAGGIKSQDPTANDWIRIAGDDAGNLINWNTGQALRFATSSDNYGSFSEHARIDSSGRLLVGTSSAPTTGNAQYSKTILSGNTAGTQGDARLAFVRNVEAASLASDSSLGQINFTEETGGEYAQIKALTDGTGGVNDYPGRLVFSTNGGAPDTSPTERMRITNAGSILFGTDATPNGTSSYGAAFHAMSYDRMGLYLATSTTLSQRLAHFFNPNGLIGDISVSGTATAYNTSSDYRLKENVIPVTDGITRLQQLKPSRFNFIADPDKTVDGFLAHEVQTIVPEAITGEKDAVDDEGNPEYQGIDQSKLVPLLTAALQEAIGRIETLEAEVAALKAS